MASLSLPAGLSVHLLGDEGLLLDSPHQRLYALNASAAFIWRGLSGGRTPAEIGRQFGDHFAVPRDLAASYVADVLGQYEALRSAGAAADEPHVADDARRVAIEPGRGGCTETCTLLGNVFRLRYGDSGLADRIHPLLYFGRPAGATTDGAVIEVEVLPAESGVVVVAAGEVIGACDSLEAAAVAVRACLIQLAIRASGGLCAVHAGAVRRNGAALLFPGDAGRGKSTLSAGLAARGFEMLCDDTTLLSGEPLRAHCLPVGLCVKRGAYPVLAADYPRLAVLPEWRRPDGQPARYLVPGEDVPWAGPDESAGVRWIVFPHYDPNVRTSLRPLRRHQALARLIRGIYFLSGTLDVRNLDTLVGWIEGIDCFDLPLTSLDVAAALLGDLCR
jgi:hypothetical protein